MERIKEQRRLRTALSHWAAGAEDYKEGLRLMRRGVSAAGADGKRRAWNRWTAISEDADRLTRALCHLLKRSASRAYGSWRSCYARSTHTLARPRPRPHAL